MGALALARMLGEERRVLAGGLQHGLHGLVGVLRRGGEAVDPVLIDPGGHAELLGPHVAHQRPVQEHGPAIEVPLGPELRVGARGKQILLVGQKILYHLHTPFFVVPYIIPYFFRLWNHPAVEFTKNLPTNSRGPALRRAPKSFRRSDQLLAVKPRPTTSLVSMTEMMAWGSCWRTMRRMVATSTVLAMI